MRKYKILKRVQFSLLMAISKRDVDGWVGKKRIEPFCTKTRWLCYKMKICKQKTHCLPSKGYWWNWWFWCSVDKRYIEKFLVRNRVGFRSLVRPLIKLKFQNEMCIILYSTENQFDMFILSNLFCLIIYQYQDAICPKIKFSLNALTTKIKNCWRDVYIVNIFKYRRFLSQTCSSRISSIYSP